MLIEHNAVAVDLWQIIAHYGYTHQKHKAVEEFAELTEALARDLQGQGDRDNIAEEMADCYIVLAQLELIYGNHGEVVQGIREKLGRTLERVEAEKKGGMSQGTCPHVSSNAREANS